MDNLQSWTLITRLVECGKRALLQGGGTEAALLKELNRINREGALGIGAIAEQNGLEMLEQADKILGSYQQGITGYSQFNEFPIEVGFEHNGLIIDETITGLHTNEQGVQPG